MILVTGWIVLSVIAWVFSVLYFQSEVHAREWTGANKTRHWIIIWQIIYLLWMLWKVMDYLLQNTSPCQGPQSPRVKYYPSPALVMFQWWNIHRTIFSEYGCRHFTNESSLALLHHVTAWHSANHGMRCQLGHVEPRRGAGSKSSRERLRKYGSLPYSWKRPGMAWHSSGVLKGSVPGVWHAG